MMKRATRLLAIFLLGLSATSFAQSSGISLDKVQEAIRDQGATWKADKIEFGLPGSSMHYGSGPFGLIGHDPFAPEPDKSFFINPKQEDQPLPPKLDWRNHKGKNWLPPVRNQGQCGSCVAFAAIGMMETQLNITSEIHDLNIDLSEQYHFGKIGQCNRGAMTYSAVNSLRNTGTPDEVCQRYVSGRMGQDVGSAGVCSDLTQRRYRIKSYKYVSRGELKKALQKGPVMTTMSVYEDFKYYKSGVYKHVTGEYLGGHAVLLVGYDDDQEAWIVRNSWSRFWGDQGDFMISYAGNSNFGQSSYAIEVYPVSGFEKLLTPKFFTANRGEVNFVFNSEGIASDDTPLRLNIKNRRGIEQGETNLVIEDNTVATVFDTTELPDGTYNVKLYRSQTENRARPSYSQWVIVNEPPLYGVAVGAQFSTEEPAQGKVYFTVSSNTTSDVPLTHAFLEFMTEDNKVFARSRIPNPGKQAKKSWYSSSVENGTYKVRAKGYIGDFYMYTSAPLTFTVKNEEE